MYLKNAHICFKLGVLYARRDMNVSTSIHDADGAEVSTAAGCHLHVREGCMEWSEPEKAVLHPAPAIPLGIRWCMCCIEPDAFAEHACHSRAT